jgi:hypothetical protein
MAGDAVDHLGGWTTSQTFAPEGAEVDLNGELINPWKGGQLSGGDSADYKHSDKPQIHTHDGISFDGEWNGGSPHLPELFEYIEPIPPGEDPELPLNSRDVCAFIVNKMIGTGIFVQPPIVLLLTGSKKEALGLWIIGFIYTIISMLLYIEFARKLPHTGGELIYV